MAFKFSKTELKELEVLVDKFDAARDELAQFLREKAEERQEDFDDKSDRWREGDTGQEAEEWLSSVNSLADEVEGFEVDLSQVEA